MRSNSKVLGWILLAAVLVGLGCQTKTPPFAAAVPQPDYYDLFTYAPGSLGMNPNLPVVTPGQPLGVNTVGPGGTFSVQSFPTSMIVVNQPLTIQGIPYSGIGTLVPPTAQPACCVSYGPSGLDDYPTEAQLNAWIEDPESPVYPPGPGNYDSVFLRAWPRSGSEMFDVSPYSGMQFYIKVDGIDSAVVKQFHIVTLQTLKGAPGECGSLGDPSLVHCYDDFYYDWSAVPRDEWVLVEQRWDAFKMYGNGSIPNPPTFSGVNLQEVFFFEWIEGNGALPGPVTVNFEVTGAKFF
jgi:hypothetical protein